MTPTSKTVRTQLSFLTSTESLVLLTAAAFLIADVAIVWIGSQADFGFDFDCCYRQAGIRLASDASTLYDWSSTYTFRYTPWAALLFSPLRLLSAGAAVWAWLLVKLAVLGVMASWFARPWSGSGRILAFLLVMTFPPLIHDLVIGNISVFVFGFMLALLRLPSGRGGALLGVLLLLAPKPYLVPVAAWLVLRNPRAGLGMVAALAGGGAVGLIAFGTETWLAFLGTLGEPLATTFTANIGFSGLLGPLGVGIGIAVGLVVFIVAVWRADSVGLGLSIVAGILAGPYTFIHYLSGTLVAAEPVLRTRPRNLSPFPWLMVIFPLIPVWLAAFAGVLARSPSPAEVDTERRATERG